MPNEQTNMKCLISIVFGTCALDSKMFFSFLICTSFLINLFQTHYYCPLLWSDEFNYEGQPPNSNN